MWFKSDKSKKAFDNLPEEYKNKYRGYQIACAQLCGNSHYIMKGNMVVESMEEYESWLNKRAEYLEDEEDEEDW